MSDFFGYSDLIRGQQMMGNANRRLLSMADFSYIGNLIDEVFADHEHEGLLDRYKYIPFTDVAMPASVSLS